MIIESNSENILLIKEQGMFFILINGIIHEKYMTFSGNPESGDWRVTKSFPDNLTKQRIEDFFKIKTFLKVD